MATIYGAELSLSTVTWQRMRRSHDLLYSGHAVFGTHRTLAAVYYFLA